MPRRTRTRRKSNLKKIIKGMIAGSQETKTIGTSINPSISNVGVNYDISSLVQGSGQNARLGNAYKMTSFRLKGAVFGSDTTNLVRIVIYLPKDPSHLIDTGLQALTPIDLDRFTVLSDRLIPTASNGPNCKLYNKVCLFNKGRRSGLNVQFHDATAGGITKNRLMVYMVSDSGAASHPSFKGWWRFYFKDA
jgi:hypothetical protein